MLYGLGAVAGCQAFKATRRPENLVKSGAFAGVIGRGHRGSPYRAGRPRRPGCLC